MEFSRYKVQGDHAQIHPFPLLFLRIYLSYEKKFTNVSSGNF